ncbi:MAG TPA: hemerythrin domain-containing protein [Burkholderiales bacterium]|nr:hemerythrin domain-containing protein [Burkholderiales bacterium]
MIKNNTSAEAPRTELDAIEMLMQDHREVESLFREFEYLQGKDEDAGRVVLTACAELRMHDTLKTELFCPAVLEASGEAAIERLLAEVEDGQQAIRDLIEQVEQTDADHDKRDAHFSALAEHVERHFKEAETQVFPQAKKLKRLDLVSVAAEMKARKSAIMAEI